MKFYVGSKESGEYFKNEIRKMFADDEGFVSVAKVTEIFRGKATNEERQIGWDEKSDLGKKMRVRQCKDGWYLYLPEPNVKLWSDKDKSLPNIDVSVFPIDDFEKLVDELVKLRSSLNGGLANIAFVLDKTQFGFYYRDCVVKAKKSGRKEERQDRNAKFHRWFHSTKGVEQELALVEFDDGHTEQVRPERIIFDVEVE